jgi:hypothetical protein
MTLLTTFLLALALIGAGVLAMAVGVIFRRPCLRGSCGGPGARAPGEKSLSCDDCPNRPRAAGAAHSRRDA